MENETQEQETVQVEQKSRLHQVTPLSKYLAMVLFIILPFVGGWIGYIFAPEKVVEVERVIEKTVEQEFTLGDLIEQINSAGYFKILDDNNAVTDFVAIGTEVYSIEGSNPSNGGQNALVQLPAASRQNFMAESYDFLGFGNIQLGIVDEQNVYFESNLIEDIDYKSLVIDVKNFNIRDEDTVYFLQSDCRRNFFEVGTFDQICVFQPSC